MCSRPSVPGGEVHESAERRGLDDLAVVGFAGLGHVRVGNLVDDGLGLLSSLATLGGDEDGTVILDVNLCTGLSNDVLDYRTALADNLADLVRIDVHGGHLRCPVGNVLTRLRG